METSLPNSFEICPEFSTNQNFLGCSCTPYAPSSYTTENTILTFCAYPTLFGGSEGKNMTLKKKSKTILSVPAMVLES